jgi:phenylalanyl-tRNA synthetase beta chain
MRAAVSWLAEHVDLPADLSARELGDALVRVGLEVERVDSAADGITGPVLVGRVRSFEAEPQKNGKLIRWCLVDLGEGAPRGVVCGAQNFAAGDLVVVALPGSVLPGGFAISARKTYGHVSDGMICSVRELGIGDEHSGILVLPSGAGQPGDDALDVLGLRESVLDIAVTPDRGYCLSIRGLAREAAGALDRRFEDFPPAPARDGDGYPVSVLDPAGCDRFSARAVAGLSPSARTPAGIVARLRASGMRPISLAVDVTNYVMLATGQPLHAFDRAKLSGPIEVRRAASGEKLVTLDGVMRALDPDDLVVADDSGPIALAGVMGGLSTEISTTTTGIVLEAAHWDPASISRAVRRHKLPSEAAKRFERGVDPQIAAVALELCVKLLAEHGGATPAGGLTVVGGGPAPAPVELAVGFPAALAGMQIEPGAVVRRLRQVGCAVEPEAGADVLHVAAPSWRPDLVDAVDLVEEVVRLEGYDRIPSVLPAAPPGRGLTDEQRFRRAVSRALGHAGYTEVLTAPFVSPTMKDALRFGADDPRRQAVVIANPLSDAEPEMRTSLLPGLLSSVLRNVGRGTRDLALFEMGLVFRANGDPGGAPRPGVDRAPDPAVLRAIDAALPSQPRHAAVVLSGDFVPGGWWGRGRPGDCWDAIEAARTIARTARADLRVRSASVAPWHPGRCAELLVDGVVVGVAGELHPGVLSELGLPERIAAMELNLDAIAPPPPAVAPVLSNFPPVLLDLALVVASDLPAADLQEVVASGAGPLLESIRLFDVYADAERLGADRKSIAFSLRFRAPDRTLTLEEATAARDAAVEAAARRFGAELRS